MTFSPTLACIPLHSHHHMRQGLEAQLRQCWAMYSAVPSEARACLQSQASSRSQITVAASVTIAR